MTRSFAAGAEVAMLDGANQIIAAIDLGATALYAKVLRGAVLRRRFLIKGTTAARHRLLGAIGRQIARRTERKERRALRGLWRPDPLLEGAAR